jgi:hypothetical protein
MISVHERNTPDKTECWFNAKSGTIEVTVSGKLYSKLRHVDSLHADIFSCKTHLHLFIWQEWGMLALGLCKRCASVLDIEIDVPLIVSNALTGENKRITVYLRK